MLPREEEPQIKVPMIDVMVSMPGATPKEVQERLTIPMEKLLYELPGVEYIYSTSMAGQSLLVVRFYVGEDLETSIVRLNQKLATNFDRIPHSVSRPLIKPHTIDDVPILALTFHGKNYDHFTLRRLAAQVDDSLKSIKDVAETKLIGGTRTAGDDPLRSPAAGLPQSDGGRNRPEDPAGQPPVPFRQSQGPESGDPAADRHLSPDLGRRDRPGGRRGVCRQTRSISMRLPRSSTARKNRTTMSSSADGAAMNGRRR